MGNWHRVSTAKQLAEYIRLELTRGHWHGKMPGVIRLAGELGASRDSVETALLELEREGLLLAQGRGKRRIIAVDGMNMGARMLVPRKAFRTLAWSLLGLV